ncbi:alpha/beta hydrolase family protein [Ceratobasidium sp. AG-Ba]|nr:alpha/beta hydrolase family protein [Ceratobasidium sp. AG-Ba]
MSYWELALFTYCTIETIFCIYHLIVAQRLRAKPSVLPQYDLHHLRNLFTRILQTGLAPAYPDDDGDIEDEAAGDRPGSPAEAIDRLEWDDPRAVDFRQRLRTWFHKEEWSSISREAMLSWLAWSCFNAPYEVAIQRPANELVLREALDMLEKRSGSKLRSEVEVALSKQSKPVQPLRLTLDPIDIIGRPALCYAVTALANLAFRAYLKRKFGVVHGKFGKLDYFLRMPIISSDEAREPIVFMHGLGIGPAQYSMFISCILREFPNRPVLVPLQPHISQSIIHPGHLECLSKTELVSSLRGLLQELGWAQADDEKSSEYNITFMSHSNGSVPHAWMLKTYPQLLRRNCFVDPVTFCLWEGDVCYNFVYKRPTNGLDILMRYFVGTELGVANHIQRQFDWSANSLWFEEIPAARDPARSAFFIGGKDSIIDGERVRRYLRSHGVRKGVRFDPEGRHGSALIAGSEGLDSVMTWLRGPTEKQ